MSDLKSNSVALEMQERFPHPSSMSFGVLLQILQEKAKLLPAGCTPRLLDFGAGSGRFMQVMQQRKVDYVAYDIDKAAITPLESKASLYPNCRTKVVIGNQKDTDLAQLQDESNTNGKYDVAIAMFGVFCSMDRKIASRLVSSLKRTMKPDGILIVAVMNGRDIQRKMSVKMDEVQPECVYNMHFTKAAPPSVVYTFTPETLVDFFQDSGFSGIAIPKHKLPESKANGMRGAIDAIKMSMNGAFRDSTEIIGVFTQSGHQNEETSSERVAASNWTEIVKKSPAIRVAPIFTTYMPKILEIVEAENILNSKQRVKIDALKIKLQQANEKIGRKSTNSVFNEAISNLVEVLTSVSPEKYHDDIEALDELKLAKQPVARSMSV